MLQSRAGTDLALRFPEVVPSLRGLGDVVLDGELVALRQGQLDFPALAVGPARRRREQVEVLLVVFDLLVTGGRDLRGLPY